MNLTKISRAARIALISLLVVVLGFCGLILLATRIPLFDPAPKGEGSFKEADAISQQFRDFYRTKDASLLPSGYVRLEGIGEDDFDGTWIIYYPTGSHSIVRGGTIMMMDSSGRIDTYFGHHCSGGDGGNVIVPNLMGSYYEKGMESVRAAFSKAFKHQGTEQAGASDGDKPPD